MTRYAKPTTVDEALALLSQADWRPLAGATDFYPAQGNRPIRENVLDLNGIAELRGISETDSHFVIGARTSWTDIQRAELPPAFDALKQAAREVGSVQIQNTGTVAGNLCNASPAADGVPPLLTLNVEVELRSMRGAQRMALGDFILGNRKTARQVDELVTAIYIPKDAARGLSAFYKLGARRYLVISIAMAAVRVVIEGGRIREAAIAVGACSAVAQRMRALEAALIGQEFSQAEAIIGAATMTELTPIDDVRGSAEYRLDAAREIVHRAFDAISRPGKLAA
ncbi:MULTISPECIES: FAD binding domain-containing protein [Mesorhizobium]|uniref:Xanthine dehydrogenase family protein subunit M n=1 Tax=Mesorhizobium denitrificans TaxID=2294114 RepID=A0A371XKA4_9HYPH|nr:MULTISPECIES: xanthine dehydrogenase family protein subunit M [Mesorhizobium]RFC69643.1 xanthine dehydrogenase family protein subunit M [Mesorhizobium denitrificans]